MGIAISAGMRVPNHQNSRDCQYSVVSESLYNIDLGRYHTYGIQTITHDRTDILHDVSVCKKTVDHIVELLNRNRASPIHLFDIVTDVLP